MTPDVPSVWLDTLGCAKNEVDSVKIQAQLGHAGYGSAESLESADIVMVNTCAFVEAARRESVDAVLDAVRRKGDDARVVVLGCMAQRYESELAAALPEVDDIVGLDRYAELATRLGGLTGWQPIQLATSPMDILYEVRRPAPTAPYAYVKVAEGCDKPCTFCAIPQFRGPQRSRPPVNIRDEVESLTESGVGEIVLVAQDLAAYGRDLAAPGGIVELLEFLEDVPGLRRLRLLYLYPREITDRLIDHMASSPTVAPYFDLSLQHSSRDLLRAMKRPGDGERFLQLIRSIRTAAPDAALRSSFIIGFPGETDAHVDELADFLVEARLDWAGFFEYSPEEGTPAADLPGRIGSDQASARLRHLAGIQDEITTEQNTSRIGDELEVLVDMIEEGSAVGRSHREAPEIDGVILLDRGEPGDWLRAEVTGAYGQELVGRVVG